MRIIISCGGTAGHINPALAIADKIKELQEQTDIAFVGSKNGMENSLVSRAGYPIWGIDVMGFKRSLSLSNVKAVIKTAAAVKQASKLIEEYSPDAVIGTGGYVCYPMLKAASKMGVYTVLHESNAIPGLAVRVLAKKMDQVFVSYDMCARKLDLKGRCVLSGNPVRRCVDLISHEQARERLGMSGRYRYLILSFGGSLGAKTVNDCALEVMESLSSKRSDILHVHSYGRSGIGGFTEEFKRRGYDRCRNIVAAEYIYDMPTYMRAADVVMSRSGAMTLSEIASSGVASVLIPSPNVTNDHQYKNAQEFASQGAAFVIDEKKDGATSNAVKYITELITDREKREAMAKSATLFSHPEAADVIAKNILSRSPDLLFKH